MKPFLSVKRLLNRPFPRQLWRSLWSPWTPAALSFWFSTFGFCLLFVAFRYGSRPAAFVGACLLVTAGLGGIGLSAVEIADLVGKGPVKDRALLAALVELSVLTPREAQAIHRKADQQGIPAERITLRDGSVSSKELRRTRQVMLGKAVASLLQHLIPGAVGMAVFIFGYPAGASLWRSIGGIVTILLIGVGAVLSGSRVRRIVETLKCKAQPVEVWRHLRDGDYDRDAMRPVGRSFLAWFHTALTGGAFMLLGWFL